MDYCNFIGMMVSPQKWISRHISLIVVFTIFTLSAYSQAAELESFRKKLTFFISYDQGKIDSVRPSADLTQTLRKELDETFLQFVRHRQTFNLNALKAQSKMKTGNTYYFDVQGYFFSERFRDMFNRTRPNNTEYHIGFYGLYDYKLPDFARMYIQPFLAGNDQLIIYSYSLNRHGVYYIKDSATNEVLYKGNSETSEAPIVKFRVIDQKHWLLVENLGDLGQRAIVLEKTATGWKAMEAFKGKEIDATKTDLRNKTFKEKRMYMWQASNRSITTSFGSKLLSLDYDEKKKLLYFIIYINGSNTDTRTIESKWNGNQFVIDDYYLGENLDDGPMPFPG